MRKEELEFIPIGKVKNNLVGQRIGNLTVIGRVYNPNNRNVLYGCLCDCGEYTTVFASNLTRNHTTSCGCVKVPNLIGRVFGKLTVVSKKEKTNSKDANIYLCKCDCGEMREVEATLLLNNQVDNCGCSMKYHTKDIRGERFGRLVALKRVDSKVSDNGRRRSVWLCKCDCGASKEVDLDSLLRGSTKSCGCLKNEMVGDKHPKWKHDLTEEDRGYKRLIEGYDEWKSKVKELADYTCECCGQRGGTLHSHHKDGYNWCKERRIDVTNGACLCKNCHKDFHAKYGNHDNTEEQYLQFLLERKD